MEIILYFVIVGLVYYIYLDMISNKQKFLDMYSKSQGSLNFLRMEHKALKEAYKFSEFNKKLWADRCKELQKQLEESKK